MYIPTIEEDYAYRMRRLMEKFVGQYEELQGLDAEELQDKIWNDYAKEFGHMVLEDMSEFSGDELFKLYPLNISSMVGLERRITV